MTTDDELRRAIQHDDHEVIRKAKMETTFSADGLHRVTYLLREEAFMRFLPPILTSRRSDGKVSDYQGISQ